MSESYKSVLKGSANPNYRNSIKKTCINCGKEYNSYDKTRKYCNHACYTTSVNFLKRNQEMINRGSRFKCVDENQAEIVDALRRAGVSICDTSGVGHGFPDLIAGLRGRNILIEVKNPKNAYGKKGLSESQEKFDRQWQGEKVHIVRSVGDALKVVGLIKE